MPCKLVHLLLFSLKRYSATQTSNRSYRTERHRRSEGPTYIPSCLTSFSIGTNTITKCHVRLDLRPSNIIAARILTKSNGTRDLVTHPLFHPLNKLITDVAQHLVYWKRDISTTYFWYIFWRVKFWFIYTRPLFSLM